MAGNPGPPRGLGDAGKALWKAIQEQIVADGLVLDARESRWLRDACAEADQLARIESALADAPLEVRGSQGQPVPNGLLGEATRCRTTIAGLLARIGLDDPATAAKPGRPVGAAASLAARRAALTRHHGSRGA